MKPVLVEAKEKLQTITTGQHLGNTAVRVTLGTLSVEQAIGSPIRQDYPLIQGKEVMIESQVMGSYGQAFTDKPKEFTGFLRDVISLNFDTTENRAIFVATLNALVSHLKMATGTRHCHDEEPEECARQIAQHIMADAGKIKVGMIGLQPAILEHLALTLGADNVHCTDLNPDNIRSKKYRAEIWDGRTDTNKLIEWSDLILATGSTIVNNTFDEIREKVNSQGKRLIIFGVTGAGIAVLLDLERVCFQAH
jgi:uncharacterized protein (DUF4213/DUF364 family)